MDKKDWHSMSAEVVLADLQTDVKAGLTENEARRRLDLVGPNQLTEAKRIAPLAIFLGQFKDFMVLVLIACTVISGFMEEYADALTILAIIVVNAVLGFVQEYRAEKSLEALKKITAPEAKVKRDGTTKKIAAADLVPGDIVLVETGDVLPADLRFLDTSQMEVSEAVLTGESLAVKKHPAGVYNNAAPLGDRKNMGYMGTVITRGHGLGAVVDTGMCTEMGQIAGLIQASADEETPLQIRLEQLGRWLVLFCFAIVGVVVISGLLRGEPLYRMLLTGVSLAVAAIPEGLPAIVTVALAVGVQKMVKRQAIVRSLPAVETLGCATVICSDKTGTLTQNEMTVREVYLSGAYAYFGGEGYDPRGKPVFPALKSWFALNKTCWDLAMKTAAFCNNAVLTKNQIGITGLLRRQQNDTWKINGDPTEGALLVAAAKSGYWRENLETAEKRFYENPFDSERKRMGVVYGEEKSGISRYYCKGAPDVILNLCETVWWEGKLQPFSRELKEKVLQANEEMTGRALRVLGLACRDLPPGMGWEDEDGLEKGLAFLGLAGMIDPPRASAREAVRVCRGAGIKTVMITGDHKNTAGAIAKELRIITDPSQKILTGAEMDQLTDYQLNGLSGQTVVYARVSPKHKMRIVKALKETGNIVAMTGDGVNDAPAVKEADIGISMGLTGTDVTKEASSLILGNDDFATIVAAVEEGRIIYDNIRKFIRYLLSCNVGEVMTMFVATLVGLPLPLIPIQILWMNLVTDGLPAIALGLDPGDPDVMNRRPRSPKESIFAHGLPRRIMVRGSIITAATLVVYLAGFVVGGGNLELARTMAFSTLVMCQLFYVFECRSERYSIFELGLFTNMKLVLAVAVSMAMQVAVIYIPACWDIFKTVPLQLYHWVIIITFSAGTSLLQGLVRTVRIRIKRRLVSF